MTQKKDLPATQVSGLERTVSQVAELIFLSEQALQMVEVIAEHAARINARRLANFFGPVQYAFFDTLTLDTFKIFDPSAKYKRHSLPEVIKLLGASHMRRKDNLIEAIVKYGLPAPSYASNECVVRMYADAATKRLRSKDIQCRLNTFKRVRNKFVAHREVNIQSKRSLNLEDTRYLLDFAKNVVSTI